MKPPALTFMALTCVALVALLVGCAPSTGGSGRAGGDATDLGAVEVEQYEGQDLSSIGDFRENSIKGPQEVDASEYRLRITGLVDQPLELTYDEVLTDRESFEKVVTLNCVEGWSVDILWEGVLVSDIIDQAEVDPSATTVIFKAVDGYSTSLPLDYIRGRQILMAHKMNGVDLPTERGFPFQLVAERKWGYKWIKWIEEIELSSDEEYRGYWEQRGYSNDGDLTGDFRD